MLRITNFMCAQNTLMCTTTSFMKWLRMEKSQSNTFQLETMFLTSLPSRSQKLNSGNVLNCSGHVQLCTKCKILFHLHTLLTYSRGSVKVYMQLMLEMVQFTFYYHFRTYYIMHDLMSCTLPFSCLIFIYEAEI